MDRNTAFLAASASSLASLSARRAWIEMVQLSNINFGIPSLSARRAWIEILYQLYDTYAKVVALRKESVDRNLTIFRV